MLAPIVLFVYNRPKHTLRTLEALQECDQADNSRLYIYCDGPKNQNLTDDIKSVRAICASENWCGEVQIIRRDENYGLARSIRTGVAEVIAQHGKAIILEDDISISKGFLNYMNDALEIYEKEDRVMHIAGFFPKTNARLPATFFYNVTTCWGWATWKRAWDHYNDDAADLMSKLNKMGADSYSFNGGQLDLLTKQLEKNASGELNTWAVKWHASVYVQQGFSLHPYPSLVVNTGHDHTGTNSGSENPFQNVQKTEYIHVEPIPIVEEKRAAQAVHQIYQPSRIEKIKKMIPQRLKRKVVQLINPTERRLYFERRRLFKMPRYQPNSAQLLEKPFYFADAATFMHGFEEIFDREIYKFKASKNDPKIIDCGSNIGLSVIYFKRLYPEAHVTAFEPDEQLAGILKRNIESFGLSHVTVNEKAIWVDNNGISFQREGGFSGRIPKPGDRENIVQVPTQRLADLLTDQVDFLKMDIEGAEYEVVKDCKGLLKNVEHLFIEYHSHINEPQTLHELLAIIDTAGFRYHIHEAYTRKHPYTSNENMVGMDLQLNIFAKKKSNA